jgi:hypothetical protein
VRDSWPGGRLGAAGSSYPWPLPELVQPAPEPRGTWDLHYVTELDAGWLAVWDAQWRAGFGMAFPEDVFRCVWVWLVDGGCRACELAAGQTLTVETRLIGFEASGPVGGSDGDGRPVGPPRT